MPYNLNEYIEFCSFETQTKLVYSFQNPQIDVIRIESSEKILDLKQFFLINEESFTFENGWKIYEFNPINLEKFRLFIFIYKKKFFPWNHSSFS